MKVQRCPNCGKPLEHKVVDFIGEITLRCSCQIEKEKKESYLADQKREDYEKKLRIEEFLKNPAIGKRFIDKNFTNFQVTKENNNAYTSCLTFVNKFNQFLDAGLGILMIGTYGCGKTHLEVAIAKELINRGYKVLFYNVTDLHIEFNRVMSRKREEEMDEFFNQFLDADLFILDDLMSINEVGSYSNYEFFLYKLISFMYLNKKSIFVSTNIPTEELARGISPRVLDRLSGITSRIKNSAGSYRKMEKEILSHRA